MVDPARVWAALLDLLANARNAMLPGGGRATVRTGTVWLDEAAVVAGGDGLKPGRYVALAVEDEGPGMPPEVLARAAEPFFTTKPGKGTGLGLATVHGFVRQSGGRLEIGSAPGRGTTVRLLFPAASADTEAPPPSKAEPVLDAKGGTETVLAVDDDAGVLDLAMHHLTALGYRVLPSRRRRFPAGTLAGAVLAPVRRSRNAAVRLPTSQLGFAPSRGVPGSRRRQRPARAAEVVRPQGHKGVEAEQRGRGARDGPVRPLPLRLDAQVPPRLLERDLGGPAAHEPGQDVGGRCVRVGAQQRLRAEPHRRVPDEDPAQGHDGQSGMVPDGGAGRAISTARSPPPYQCGTVMACQEVCGSARRRANAGWRWPTTRGRPIVPGARGGAGSNRRASVRSRATTHTRRRTAASRSSAA